MVHNGAAFIALLRLPEGEAPLVGSRSQKGHVAFRVSNKEFQALRERLPTLLKEHQVYADQSVDIIEEDYGVQQSLFFFDPDGNELEVTTWDAPRVEDGGAFLERALLLDVRSQQEFQQMALPKSLNVPHVLVLDAAGGGID